MVDLRLARPLRAAGHLIFLPAELGTRGEPDEAHLTIATAVGATLATYDQKDFARLHHSWAEEGRDHAGIVLAIQNTHTGIKLAALDRIARLLSSDAAKNQLLYLASFDTDEGAASYIASLGTG